MTIKFHTAAVIAVVFEGSEGRAYGTVEAIEVMRLAGACDDYVEAIQKDTTTLTELLNRFVGNVLSGVSRVDAPQVTILADLATHVATLAAKREALAVMLRLRKGAAYKEVAVAVTRLMCAASASEPDEDDDDADAGSPEACPGCGCVPGDGRTVGCAHALGCGVTF